ncbi:HTH-type transcriptional regulator celR [Serinicoccus hydrothermalis]|uniref:HTH-type transcriptional regulator celR n=1 Tax=Serinicoccus hydrothermalis TaxID=1758689 RepID=A0A1B1N9P3_9MICO|nr:LacI family DNA-binding transcriptional regulator [Serinicoccus hydrothermalis]ANS78170.1 HTH-type transcriptional regulator celR [Serinicoccus hydrothermalis]
MGAPTDQDRLVRDELAEPTNGRSRPPTLEDVAARAGVSRATASRVVNADPRVRPQARDAVVTAVAELGYRPNRAARSLVVREPDSVAVVVPETEQRVFADPVIMGMLRGIGAGLDDSPLQMVLVLGRAGRDTERLERWLRGGHTDGAIVLSAHLDDQITGVLSDIGLPTVIIGRPPVPAQGLPYVDLDNVSGGRVAAQRLLDRGCTRIGTVAGPPDMAASRDRLEGWRETMLAAGLPADAVEHGDFSSESGRLAMRRLLAAHPDLDGVFVASDLMAVAAVGELQSRGHRVPEDVAVVGYDDSPAAELTTPRLTTVANPSELLATEATRLLRDLLAGRQVDSAVLPTHLVEGGTA